MKKIFIYYSLSGNGDVVANYLSNNSYDIRKVNVKNPLPENFTLSMLTGGFKAFIKYKEKLIDFNDDVDSYDYVLIGSPIWNDRLSSVINTILNKMDLSNKKVDFILYSASGSAKHASKYINEKYPDSKIIILKEPKKYKEELDKIILK